MDILLVVAGLILCIVGLVGSFLPILPGPISSWSGLFLLNFSGYVNLENKFLIITFLIAISISILDYLIPILGVKKLGGTKGGQIGASLGVIIGLFFLGPLGLIAGPFIGSLTGEFISKKNLRDSIYPALGSLIGTLAGTIIKFFVSMIFTIYFLYKLLESI
jgi:uncharacterized protein YqgC (DUF456 family)